MTTVSETPDYKILFFKTAADATRVSSAAGANGFSLMAPDGTELVSLPDAKWSTVDLTWIPDLTTAPTEVFQMITVCILNPEEFHSMGRIGHCMTRYHIWFRITAWTRIISG